MSDLPDWPKELPWLQFDRLFREGIEFLPLRCSSDSSAKTSTALQFLTTNTVARPLWNCRGQDTLSIQMMRPDYNPLGRTSGSRELHLHAPRIMRAALEMIAPQVHEGDHETTVEIFHTGSKEALAVELFRLFVYLEANDMMWELNNITGCGAEFSNVKHMMDFLRCMGLLSEANIEWLGRSANLAIEVFLERLLYYSTVDGNSFDVLKWLVPGRFSVNHVVRGYESSHTSTGDVPLYSKSVFLSLLEASSVEGNTSAVRFLLDLGADPHYHPSKGNYSPLHWAARLRDQDRAVVITALLLTKQTTSSSAVQKKSLNRALEGALTNRNTKLIEVLLSEYQRMGHGRIWCHHFSTAAGVTCLDTIRILVHHDIRHGNGFVMLPEDILFSAVLPLQPSRDPDALADMLNYLLGLGADPTVLECDDCKRGFILDHVMGLAADAKMEEDCVLRIVEAMRKHGCPPRRPKPASGGDYTPSVLQAAIALGYPRLVKYLLDWGFDANFYTDYSGYSETSECSFCQQYQDMEESVDFVQGRSPLLTALHYQRPDIAKMLLRRFPELKLRGGEPLLALEMGDDTELVAMLLQAGSTDVDAWKYFLEQALLMRKPETIKMLMSLNTHDHAAIDTATILRAALIVGDQDTAYKQIATCSYNSQALLEAVFRSHISKDYLRVVELLLESRQPTPNDDFEICAVASAAIHHDMYLMGVLMSNLGQGPWIARFPLKKEGREPHLSAWVPDGVSLGFSMHILEYAAEFDKDHQGTTVFTTLLEFDVPAQGMCLDALDRLSADRWTQLIAAGADFNLMEPLYYAVRFNMLAHIEALCRAPVLLNKMHHDDHSRTAIQEAVESTSPEMLQILLLHGADVNNPAGYYRGATCLQLAAGRGRIGIVRLMLDKGAEVNAKRSLFYGRTAIEIAAENGRLDVLKLLLLRDQHLFQTASERYQFIRAAKLADITGNKFIIDMLKKHIQWNSNDQQLFDEIQSHRLNIHLDEMTQSLLVDDKLDDDFWDKVDEFRKYAGLDDIYEIDGIEQWIGRPEDEEPDDWTTSETGHSSEGQNDLPPEDEFSTDHYTEATNDGRVLAGEPRRQSELQSLMNNSAEVALTYDAIHDNLAGSVDSGGDLIDEQRTRQLYKWRLYAETGESTQISAPQALRHQDINPVWLEMEGNDIDNMLQDLSGGLDTQLRTHQALAHRPATQTVDQESGMTLGEVLDRPHVNDMGDDAVDDDHVMDIDAADHSIAQDFNWGFWDEESFRFQSGQPVYW